MQVQFRDLLISSRLTDPEINNIKVRGSRRVKQSPNSGNTGTTKKINQNILTFFFKCLKAVKKMTGGSKNYWSKVRMSEFPVGNFIWNSNFKVRKTIPTRTLKSVYDLLHQLLHTGLSNLYLCACCYRVCTCTQYYALLTSIANESLLRHDQLKHDVIPNSDSWGTLNAP